MIVALTLTAGAVITPSVEASSIRNYRVPTANADPFYIAAGAKNDLWFSENRVGKVGRITTRGVITEYRLGNCRVAAHIAARNRDVWVGCLGKIKRLRVTYRTNRPPSVRVSEIRLPAGNRVVDMETARDGSLWYVTGGHYGRIAPSGTIQERADPAGAESLAITPAGEVWISSGHAIYSVNQNRSAYLSRIDAGLNVAERQVVPDNPQPALIRETFVGGLLATNSNSLLFTLDWASETEPDTNTRLFGQMTNARQFRLSPSVFPEASSELFRGRGYSAWLLHGTLFVRLNDDGSVARRYELVRGGRGFSDAAQGADGRFWVTQTSSNSIGRVTLTP